MRCGGDPPEVLDQVLPLHQGECRGWPPWNVCLCAFLSPVVLEKVSVPDKHALQSHEHDLPFGPDGKIVSNVYVHFPPIEMLDILG